MLTVPPEFNRNAADVQALGAAALTGASLLAYMAKRLDVSDLGGLDILDFGCGGRFAESIVNLGVPVRSYTGVDQFRELMEYLSANANDPRLRFFHADFQGPFYNPNGTKMEATSTLPVGEMTFDVVCMFSVITHQIPDDAEAIFHILRRYVRPTGHLFFSAAIEEDGDDYHEALPDCVGALSIYTSKRMKEMLAQANWEVLSWVHRNPENLPILESFLCRPV